MKKTWAKRWEFALPGNSLGSVLIFSRSAPPIASDHNISFSITVYCYTEMKIYLMMMMMMGCNSQSISLSASPSSSLFSPFFVNFHHFLLIFTIYALLSRFTFCRDLRTFSAIFVVQNSLLRNITRFLHVCFHFLISWVFKPVCFIDTWKFDSFYRNGMPGGGEGFPIKLQFVVKWTTGLWNNICLKFETLILLHVSSERSRSAFRPLPFGWK